MKKASLVCRKELLAPFAKLLEDMEAEVRVATATSLSGFSRHLTEKAIITSIVPLVKVAAQDSTPFVRAAVASAVLELAPILGKQNTIDYLLEIFLLLLRDQFPEVRPAVLPFINRNIAFVTSKKK